MGEIETRFLQVIGNLSHSLGNKNADLAIALRLMTWGYPTASDALFWDSQVG